MTAPPWNDDFERILRSYCRLNRPGAAIDPDAAFAALGVDSLSLLGLIVDTEKLFGVAFPIDMLTVEVLFTPAAFWQGLQELRGNDAGVAS